MKPSKYTFFTSLLCASGLSAGLCFCVMTSFAVPADGPVSYTHLTLPTIATV